MTKTPETITRIEVLRLVIPLEHPVRLGPMPIRERAYVALRLELDGGAVGYAYGYDRGMPLFEIAVEAARRYLGHPLAHKARLRHESLGPTPAPRATMVRGVSLCDIALWDAEAQVRGLPLHAMLGTLRDRIELMPVIGYGMSPQVAAEQGAALAQRGFRTIKLMIDGSDFAFDRDVVRALKSALPEGVRFGLDAHWSWRRAQDALPWCRLAEETGALFLEDPVAPTDWRIAAELRRHTEVPVCLGEDAIDLAALRDMAEGADILRLDAAASGGIGYVLDGLALARVYGKAVIPHVFASLHQHLGFADQAVSRIEAILPELGADPIESFLTQPIRIEAGMLVAPETPGTGLALDWEAMQSFISRREVLIL
ncbi:mandelate racemase/muconate lactonizing enzyme family protein [Paracoccus saliphilus]|uniref:L-alanine-DL-glutamate epimerase n=1 Tax=Paracoccus saliphilus TaxID=405559 RepID=A0AA45W2K9_9RHOB|nr:mandelate racemase/muconate lactonizing enzyme family protein [Paracoccus saliphilus]WCR01475.1 mandelate racemase/muconate lactonizing enzyme family protein [Paracoccus saliphilus]SIS68986.1 L-alanine-DL-glutamate epimerase [Paracoccus saliphilus]